MFWVKRLLPAGVQPSEAKALTFCESAYLANVEFKNNDFTLMLYHQRMANGCPQYDN